MTAAYGLRCGAELGQALRRFSLRGELPDAQASVLVRDLLDVPIRRYPHVELLAGAVQLRANVTVYARRTGLQCSGPRRFHVGMIVVVGS